MPWKPKKVCNKAGCNRLTADSYCDEHKHQQKNSYAPSLRYGRNWKARAKAFKAQNPLCIECLKEGKIVPVYGVDHIIPHRGNVDLYWDETNWQSLCQHHLNAKTGRGL
jgi:5-methylcytosine-specific restriction enzyme A